MSRAEVCRALGVSSRTLGRLVKSGRVSRLWIDGEPRYRASQKLVEADTKAAIDESLDAAEGEVSHGVATNEGDSANDVAELHSDNVYLPALVALVDQLTERLIFTERALAIAERERDHALSVAGDMATQTRVLMGNFREVSRMVAEANQALSLSNRNSRRLHVLVEGLAAGVAEIAGSPLAVLIRGRLQSLLEGR
jgi:hypothetical protein